jgi:glycolate oxidase
MSLIMPVPDQVTLDKSETIISDLKKISKNVLSEEEEKAAYETDGLSIHRQRPIVVVLPETTAEVSKVLKYCYDHNIKVVPRGAGTGLSGAALPLKDSVLVGLGKFNKILEIDFENRCVVTQPGVTNLAIPEQFSTRVFIMLQIHLVN